MIRNPRQSPDVVYFIVCNTKYMAITRVDKYWCGFPSHCPPNSRFESRDTRRVASAVPRGAGSAGRNLIIRGWTIQSLEQLEIKSCNRSASLFQNAEVLHLEIYLGFLYFCWTNPSDIPIFGNTGWWIMFRPVGRPLILLPDQRNRFAICPRLPPQQQRHEIWEYVTSWRWAPSSWVISVIWRTRSQVGVSPTRDNYTD